MDNFHGRTMGALALTSKGKYRTSFEPVMPCVKFVEFGNVEVTKKEIHTPCRVLPILAIKA